MKERIRNILREERSIQNRVMDMIKDLGSEKTFQVVGSFERFKKIMNIETPMDYLRLFEGMDSVLFDHGDFDDESVYNFYRFKKGNNFMVTYDHFDSEEKRVILHWDEIWDVLEDRFGLTFSEALELLTRWVQDTYKFENFYVDRSGGLATDGWMSKEMV